MTMWIEENSSMAGNQHLGLKPGSCLVVDLNSYTTTILVFKKILNIKCFFIKSNPYVRPS